MAKTDTASGPSVADVLAELGRKHDLRVGAASEVVAPVSWLTTGNLGIDHICGGGLPLGRTVELYGQPSSGKTTTALQAAAALQADLIAAGRDEHILYLDYEHAFDADYAAALGLDIEHRSFLLAQPHSMEQGAEAALKLITTGKVRLSIWDSVAAMAPIARLEGEFDQRTAAMNKARLMSGLLLQLTPLLHKHASTAVFINHLMESVEMNAVRPGMPAKVTTPGGKALKFYASIRCEFRQLGLAKAKDTDPLSGEVTNQAVATHIKIKCVKNKVAAPNREAEARVSYGRGFDNPWSALQVLLAHKLVRKDGAWYRFDPGLEHPAMKLPASAGKNGRPSIQGETAVLRFAAEHPDWRAGLIATAAALLADTAAEPAAPGEPDNLDEVLASLDATGNGADGDDGDG